MACARIRQGRAGRVRGGAVLSRPDLSPDEFRRAGYAAVDWISNYLDHVREFAVLPGVQPGDIRDSLPTSGPLEGESIEQILGDFERLIVPGMTLWNHPRFLAYFSITGSGPGILAEFLAAALNVNGMLWKTSPAVTELEQVTLGWLLEWMGLPRDWFGIIYDTASISTLHAIAAARERIDPNGRENGAMPGLVLYTSEQAHSSVEKGAITLGIGRRNVRKVPVDDQFRMRPDVLKSMIDADEDAGKKPFCIVATIGTTSTTSVDPVPEIADIADAHKLWLHVDAAYGGAMGLVPEYRHLLAGAERADSLVVNPHKWMFVPVDLSVFYTRHPDVLRRAFSLVPDYLKTTDGAAVNYMDYGVQLGRRFRSLKLWFVLRYFGHTGLAEHIRRHVALAQKLALAIERDPRFELSAPTVMSTVCFRQKGTDQDNHDLIERVNREHRFFLASTVLRGQTVVRAAIGNLRTSEQDIDDLIAALGVQ